MKKVLKRAAGVRNEGCSVKRTLTVLCYVLDILSVMLYNGVSFFEENVINEE